MCEESTTKNLKSSKFVREMLRRLKEKVVLRSHQNCLVRAKKENEASYFHPNGISQSPKIEDQVRHITNECDRLHRYMLKSYNYFEQNL